MNGQDLIFTLKTIALSKDQHEMQQLLQQCHPADIGAVFGAFDLEQVCLLLALTPAAARAELFGYIDKEKEADIVQALDAQAASELFLHMSPDERADLFNVLSEEDQARVLPGLAQAEREDIRRLASYDEDKTGSVMTSDYALLDQQLTAAQGIARLRKVAPDKETIYQAYIVDADRRLLGTVSLRQLIMAEPEQSISDFMQRDPIFVRADAPREIAAQLIAKYDLLALPVINGGNKLVGIVTYDDAMDVASEEADLDFHKSSAVGQVIGSIKDASVKILYQKRVFWLVLLVFGNIFSGAGIAYFEDTIAAYVALVFFLPLLVDSGGNAGSQSATLMVRALATGEIVLKDWAGMLGREFLVAGLLGLTMATAVSLLGLWRGGPEIALVVALTMQLVVIMGSVIGMSLPFVLSRLKLDPAAASAPLITSIADACGVLIYFGMATWLLELPVAA
ncbi:magnesium transporter [Alkalimonas collagenimarina]|uniref:Magnesium transporter MgtE n=1 Tax=Alkalimonas collagenimarina TaxID=400390 RepID=A0ABT9GXM3_9GAMM|nr:magnesium transporter [Alkalimonas collagenimarina]MDP4535796.1 magnesium transporter [Alkalimonas collagenimarina]